ncbi:MAG: VOC family protein [Inquilinus sp.]|nr:VOC family protein [Inquilinus sp.]
MHKSRLGVVVIDCEGGDLEQAAKFWSRALGRAVGKGDDRYVDLAGPDGELRVLLQKVEHPSRVHLDIETDDLEAEVARLEKLGAKRIGAVKRWVVMEAPTGHRFCVVRPQRPDFESGAMEWVDE